MTPTLAQSFAHYNSRMNEKVYRAVRSLSDAERRADRGAFFGSIWGTLNHILWADEIWLARFERRAVPAGLHTTEMAQDFHTLSERRELVDRQIEHFTTTLRAADLLLDFTWTSTQGRTQTRPFWAVITHLFNHQTHHRGQVTTLLSQFGVDVGVTDFPFVHFD